MVTLMMEIVDGIVGSFIVLMGINYFMYVGNYRVIFRYTKWSKYQIILGKVTFLIASLVYFGIATFFMRFDFGFDP